MKNTIKWYILILLFTFSVGCDDEFKEINSNPNAVTDIDDEYLFANAVLQSLREMAIPMLSFLLHRSMPMFTRG